MIVVLFTFSAKRWDTFGRDKFTQVRGQFFKLPYFGKLQLINMINNNFFSIIVNKVFFFQFIQ